MWKILHRLYILNTAPEDSHHFIIISMFEISKNVQKETQTHSSKTTSSILSHV